jgi:hypothetical protein
MQLTTARQIVGRALTGWPPDSVDYSQSQIWNDDDGSGPHIGGYRMDCSGFASMAAGLSKAGGGLTTVTFVTTGAIKRISWGQLRPGDFVGACGPGTAGNDGHIMVVISVNRLAGTYTVMEQAGYGPGPDRNTYRIGDGQGRNYLPYRLTTLEERVHTIVPGPDNTLWLADGTFVRKISGDKELADIRYLDGLGAITLWRDANGHDIWDGGLADAFGVDVATLQGIGVGLLVPHTHENTPTGPAIATGA